MLDNDGRSIKIRRWARWFMGGSKGGGRGMTRAGILAVMGVWVAMAGRGEASEPSRVPTLERDIQPLLTRFGCNAGACHGKQRGQNGFQLSLLGFDPAFDLNSLAREGRGRRIFPAAPEESLLLTKATGREPHGGGKRIERDGPEYRMLRDWIAAGTPRDPAEAPKLVEVAVTPTEQVMEPEAKQELKVTARYSDGSTEDVTALAAFASNESAIAGVSERGVVSAGTLPGEAAIMARFRNNFATCFVTIPQPGTVPGEFYDGLPRQNFIDGLVWAKLKTLGITPSDPASEHLYLRRAYLDVIGRLPTAEEARAYLGDMRSDKRARLVDGLLERPEYADHWASKWADLLRPNPYRVGIKAVFNLDAFLRDQFRRNVPYDQFVRNVVTAKGSTWRPTAATVFRDRREPEELTTIVSQLFLGIRLECAKCHHHPFEVWGQDDFYEFAAYFAKVGRKGTGLSPPISGGEEIVFAGKKGRVTHPSTGQEMAPAPLFGQAPAADGTPDPRDALAAWITGPENPYFARVAVNRVWAEVMGRGLVEPVDDLRATNPPRNGPLLEALADDFRAHGFDQKHLLRTILGSYVYGLSSTPNERNVSDTRNFSRHYRQRPRAEVLLDAVCDITGIPERFDAAPPGARANTQWTVRGDSLFLDTFGRPDPNLDPPCERDAGTSVVQALHLMNAPDLHAKVVDDKALAATLAASEKSPDEIAEELYLRVYSRFPDEAEKGLAREILGGSEDAKARRAAVEDLLWALLNTPEFVFED